VRAEHVIDSWKNVRQDTCRRGGVPAGEFDYRPAADLQTSARSADHPGIDHGLTGMLRRRHDFTARFSRPHRHPRRSIPETLEPASWFAVARIRGRAGPQLAAQTPEFWLA